MRRRQLIATALALPLLKAHAAEPGDWYFIFLETGKPTPDDKAAVQQMQKVHLDNFMRLHGEYKLFAAGPMRDPARVKRGFVVCRAESREALEAYFQPDDYVREGYMTVNAAVATAHRTLVRVDKDPGVYEEVRIVLLSRDGQTSAAIQQQRHKLLQQGLDDGRFGAWYSLKTGAIAEVLFARSTDDEALRAALAGYPGVADKTVSLDTWPLYLGKGVLP